jgi:hypothetical protein
MIIFFKKNYTAELVKGNTVTTPDGTVIHPHQVLGPPRPGMVIIKIIMFV